jgi:hypothetical protein
MATSLIVFVLAFALGCNMAIADSESGEFNAKEFLLGDWELELHRSPLTAPSAFGFVATASWKIKDGNETLYGVAIDEKDDERQLRVEFEGESKGQFLLAVADEESEEFVPVFAFAFTNRTAGHFVSQGEWKDEQRAEAGVYQLAATSPNTFLLTLWLTDATGVGQEVVTITGKKFVEKPAQTFFQRFGMPMAVVGMMIVSQVLKSRSAGAAAAAQQPPQQAAARPGQQAAAGEDDDDASEEEPRFTEITDKKDQ